jgi:ABC-type polysaccharide/polyol phosphate export permease
LIDFAVASVVAIVVLSLVGTGVSIHLVWVPLMIAVLVALVMGCGMFLSAASLFFRDVKYIVDATLTFAIFFTPVFYEAEMFGPYANLIMLNPVAPILEGMNSAVVLHEMPNVGWFWYSVIWSIVVCSVGFVFFKRVEPTFAESI